MTQIWNHLLNALFLVAAILAALPADLVDVVPAKAKPYIVGAVAVAMWIKSHRNLFINPDGTNARAPYQPTNPPAA